jgi:hypothetical protein
MHFSKNVPKKNQGIIVFLIMVLMTACLCLSSWFPGSALVWAQGSTINMKYSFMRVLNANTIRIRNMIENEVFYREDYLKDGVVWTPVASVSQNGSLIYFRRRLNLSRF